VISRFRGSMISRLLNGFGFCNGRHICSPYDLVQYILEINRRLLDDESTSQGRNRGHSGFCFRGIDNAASYILERDRSRYANFSGTGNTLNANQPVVRGMIVDSFCYWVEHMHVDRFRFDLASILARDSDGHPMSNPPLLWDIESDPALAGTKMIAEAWGAAGR